MQKGYKKIVLVSSAFYPEISPRSFRATELAKEFSRQGHEVTVISRFRNYDYIEFLKEYPVTLKMWTKKKFPDIPVCRKKPFSFISRALSRVLVLLFEYPGIEEMFQAKKMLKYEQGYDLMISFAVPYPVHWGVAWARSKKHRIAAIWAADCGDPYMGDVLDTFRKPFYFRCIEKWFSRKADHITIPVESAKPAYYAEFHPKIVIIPQGFNFDLNKQNEKLNSDKKYESHSVPEFAYAGGFIPGSRDPSTLLQFLTEIDLPFKFYIYTNQPEFLNKYLTLLNGRLILSGYIDRNTLMEKLSTMDFLINLDNNTTLNVPSKLIDYAILNRPVLNVDKYIKKEDILAFLTRDFKKRMQLPSPEQYHITNVSHLFLKLLHQ